MYTSSTGQSRYLSDFKSPISEVEDKMGLSSEHRWIWSLDINSSICSSNCLNEGFFVFVDRTKANKISDHATVVEYIYTRFTGFWHVK